MLNGVARLVDSYGESLKDDIFKEKNGVVSVKSIIRTAKERHAGALGYAETLLLNYNKKMPGSSALPMEKLYTNRKKLLNQKFLKKISIRKNRLHGLAMTQMKKSNLLTNQNN